MCRAEGPQGGPAVRQLPGGTDPGPWWCCCLFTSVVRGVGVQHPPRLLASSTPGAGWTSVGTCPGVRVPGSSGDAGGAGPTPPL